MTRPRLTLTQDRFEGLHAALAKVRSTSRTVTVDRQALTDLLIDHGAILAHHREIEEQCK